MAATVLIAPAEHLGGLQEQRGLKGAQAFVDTDAHSALDVITRAREGQPVEFVLDDREIAIDGTYAGQTFWSRWTKYDLERVGSWRLTDSNTTLHV